MSPTSARPLLELGQEDSKPEIRAPTRAILSLSRRRERAGSYAEEVVGESSAGAFWMVKSSVMMGLTPRAVDKLRKSGMILARRKVQLANDETTNPGADPFATRVFVGLTLIRVVLG